MESSRGRFDILLRYPSGLRKAITALTKKTVTKVSRAEMAIQLMLPALSRMYLYMANRLRFLGSRVPSSRVKGQDSILANLGTNPGTWNPGT
jgi:hypothetical protein